MQFFQETTKWKDAVPNGIYLLDDSKSKMYAFIKAGEKSVFTFKNPIRISTRGRTFVPVKNTFNYKIKEDTAKADAETEKLKLETEKIKLESAGIIPGSDKSSNSKTKKKK